MALSCTHIEVTGWSSAWVDLVSLPIFVKLAILFFLKVSEFDTHALGLLVPILTLAFFELSNAHKGLLHSRVELILLQTFGLVDQTFNFDSDTFHVVIVVDFVLLFLSTAVLISPSKHLLLVCLMFDLFKFEVVS